MRWMNDRRVVVDGVGTSGAVAHWVDAPSRKSAPSVTTDSPGWRPDAISYRSPDPAAQVHPPAGEAAPGAAT